MRKRIVALALFLLMLLPRTIHADVLFLDPSGIANTFLREKSVPLDAASNEFIALTDLIGWQHPYFRNAVAQHETGCTLVIRCLYTDDYGNVWALHQHIQEFGRDCWLPCDGLAPVSAVPLPLPPETLPVPRPSIGTLVLLTGGMILCVLLLTLSIRKRTKRKMPDA